MYGLDNSVDLSFFIGRRLIQVSIGANELILRFDNEVAVTVESDFSVCDSGEPELFNRSCDGAATLAALLDRVVSRCTTDGTGSLRIVFDDQRELTVFDSSSTYEGYTIRNGSHLIVV